jgi:hypothetical protein
MGPPRRMLLVPLPGQMPHFFLHHQAHQRQPGFAHEMANALLQQADDLGHRNDHLEVGILLAGQLPEFLHRPLPVDLVSFLHSDSLLFFLAEKTTAIIMTAVESRYFLRINGHPHIGCNWDRECHRQEPERTLGNFILGLSVPKRRHSAKMSAPLGPDSTLKFLKTQDALHGHRGAQQCHYAVSPKR